MTDPSQTPRPRMKDFDKYRKHGAYHWKYLQIHEDYRRRVEAVCERVAPGSTCLDLGCGDGAYMYEVARKCRHVVGVDGDEAGIRCAEEELSRRGVANYTLVHSTFAELRGRLPWSIRRYDLIYCMDCIEHLFEPEEVIDLMRRLLTPGGLIILGTPLFVSEEEVSRHHVKEFTVPELHALLLPHFRPEEERYLDAPLPSSQALVKRFYVFYGRRRDRRPWWRRVWRRPPAGEPPARGGGEVRYCRPESYRSRVAQEEVSCVGKYAGSQASLAHHERHWLAPGYLEDLRLTFRELLGPSYGGTVLDVGCGMGHLHRRLGIASERYTGVDINRLFLDAGRRSFPGLRLVQGEAACLPFADNRFDCVLCSDVLIHLEDMRPALRELIRVSRGKVLLRLRSGNGGFQGPKVVHDPRRDRLFLKLTLGAERRYFYYNVLAPEDLLALLLREGIEKYHALDLLPADAGAMGLTKVLFDVGQAKGAQGKSSG